MIVSVFMNHRKNRKLLQTFLRRLNTSLFFREHLLFLKLVPVMVKFENEDLVSALEKMFGEIKFKEQVCICSRF